MPFITVIAHARSFRFPISEDGAAWFDLDSCVSECGDMQLAINADREVYACLTAPDGTAFYGTIGDSEDELIADNFGISPGETYIFYDHPEAETRYL